jgi:hypothetical protein
LRGVKFVERNFLLAEFWNIFAYSSTYISAMVKWMVSYDSVYQIGPVSTPHDLFNSSDDDRGGEVCWAEF